MVSTAYRGQILIELLWIILILFSFAVFMVRLHENAQKVAQKNRWETPASHKGYHGQK